AWTSRGPSSPKRKNARRGRFGRWRCRCFPLLAPAGSGDYPGMAIRAAQGAVFQRLHGEPASLELVLYHDVLCSWCYVADARLEYLRDEYGPLVRWRLRPYPLRPENQLPDKKQRAVLARHFRRVSREREGVGIKADLWTGADPPSSSLPPLVALEAALPQGSESQRELLNA